jgi:hypothetical protein
MSSKEERDDLKEDLETLRYVTQDWVAKTRYNDRGDPSAYDFDLTDLTTDGAWHDLDFSSVVTGSAKALNLFVVIQDDAAGSDFFMRKNGNSNERNLSGLTTQVANQYFRGEFIVGCDGGKVVEYQATNTTWTGIWICVKGWW